MTVQTLLASLRQHLAAMQSDNEDAEQDWLDAVQEMQRLVATMAAFVNEDEAQKHLNQQLKKETVK